MILLKRLQLIATWIVATVLNIFNIVFYAIKKFQSFEKGKAKNTLEIQNAVCAR